jgi:starvation-inducible DNA-binding protein
MKTQESKTTGHNAVVSEKLNQLLADYQIFYQNLRGLHWNVKGAMFFMLHEKFEEYYNEAAETIDEIAERIVMLGGKPLHSFSQYLNHTSLREVENVSDGKEAIGVVLSNSNDLLKQFKDILKAAGETGDEGTVALMSDLISSAEKRSWMLSSVLA